MGTSYTLDRYSANRCWLEAGYAPYTGLTSHASQQGRNRVGRPGGLPESVTMLPMGGLSKGAWWCPAGLADRGWAALCITTRLGDSRSGQRRQEPSPAMRGLRSGSRWLLAVMPGSRPLSTMTTNQPIQRAVA